MGINGYYAEGSVDEVCLTTSSAHTAIYIGETILVYSNNLIYI